MSGQLKTFLDRLFPGDRHRPDEQHLTAPAMDRERRCREHERRQGDRLARPARHLDADEPALRRCARSSQCPAMDLGLDGRVCVVTGATRGVGLEVGRRLCAEGARVLFVGRDAEALVEAAEGCGGEYLAGDITDPEIDERIVATCAEQMGGIDVLVNNAGTSFARALDELTDDDWQSLWQLHVMAPMRLMRAAAPRMVARGGGRIVNVCSSAGKRPSLTNPAYSVTKAAQLSLSRVFADSYAAGNVLVNAVAPGPVASPLWTAEGGLADQNAEAHGISREEALKAQTDKVPLGRFAEPKEIADVIVFLCSERASTVTGAAWSADGGAFAAII
jgi:3-oxoacyl-[acyl-carrier protein] reductase